MMNLGLAQVLSDVVGKVFDRVWPDPEKKAQAQLELLKLQQAGEFKAIETDLALALGQIETNKVEAASESLFKSGWRPAVGWVCAGGLLYQLLARPIVGWAMLNAAGWSIPPSLEMDTLLTLLFGLLGLGAYRTYEKVQGKQ